MNQKKQFPDTLIIISFLLLLFAALTWIVPAGEYQRQEINGKNVVIPDSYEYIDQSQQGLLEFLSAPIKGFVSAGQIIAFIFIVGGAFSVINSTGAINSALLFLIKKAKNSKSKRLLIIPILMSFFSLAGATFGMSEETLVFILITIPLAKALGFDEFVGVAIPFIGAGVGFAGAFMNPFTVGIAQGIAEIQIFSGMGYRIIVWSIFTAAAIIYVTIYAKNKIQNNNSNSELKIPDELKNSEFTNTRKTIIFLLIVALAVIVYGVINLAWYINEISAVFVALAAVSVFISRMRLNNAASSFYEGAKDMVTAAVIIAMAKGMLVLAEDGKIIDTILLTIASNTKNLHPAISVQIMYLMQSTVNFFIPSGSGQAALTMPLLAPLSDVLGITRQTAVLAYQFGDGITNFIIPTSGVTMGVLSIAKIPYNKWLKFMLPLFFILTLLAMLLLLPPILIFNYT